VNETVLELETSDGVPIAARRWPVTAAPSGTSVVVAHGFAASGSEEKVVAVAEALAARGHAVLTYDSRGHGDSGGEATLGTDEALDVAAVVDAADPEPVVVVGASMGAIGVLRHAVARPQARPLTGVVILSCPARWSLPRNARGVLSALMTQTPLGRWGARRYMHVRIARPRKRPPPPIDLVPALHVPLAILHGADDPFIPVADADALYAVANEPRRLDVVEGLGHAFEARSVAPVVGAVGWVIDQR
jgi:pimeloyl-ACP methyl ester carboxylesterase